MAWKAFTIASIPQYDECQCGLASVVYNFFDENPRDTTTDAGIRIQDF